MGENCGSCSLIISDVIYLDHGCVVARSLESHHVYSNIGRRAPATTPLLCRGESIMYTKSLSLRTHTEESLNNTRYTTIKQIVKKKKIRNI